MTPSQGTTKVLASTSKLVNKVVGPTKRKSTVTTNGYPSKMLRIEEVTQSEVVNQGSSSLFSQTTIPETEREDVISEESQPLCGISPDGLFVGLSDIQSLENNNRPQQVSFTSTPDLTSSREKEYGSLNPLQGSTAPPSHTEEITGARMTYVDQAYIATEDPNANGSVGPTTDGLIPVTTIVTDNSNLCAQVHVLPQITPSLFNGEWKCSNFNGVNL